MNRSDYKCSNQSKCCLRSYKRPITSNLSHYECLGDEVSTPASPSEGYSNLGPPKHQLTDRTLHIPQFLLVTLEKYRERSQDGFPQHN